MAKTVAPSFFMMKLQVKQALVGTPLAGVAERIRWWAQAPKRHRHPELWDFYLEDRRTRLALAQLIEPHHRCIDVGAHIGSVLVDICRLAPGQAHVAFEPTPAKAAALRKKFPHVEVIEAAVSDETGRATFFDDVDRPGFSGLQAPLGDSTVRNYNVDVVTIDERLDLDQPVHFVKIDVEGAELPALRGAHELLVRHKPPLLFECGPDVQLQPFGYKRVDLFEFLVERGYDVYSMVDYVFGRAPMTRESFDKAGTYPFRGFNFLALPPDRQVVRLI